MVAAGVVTTGSATFDDPSPARSGGSGWENRSAYSLPTCEAVPVERVDPALGAVSGEVESVPVIGSVKLPGEMLLRTAWDKDSRVVTRKTPGFRQGSLQPRPPQSRGDNRLARG